MMKKYYLATFLCVLALSAILGQSKNTEEAKVAETVTKIYEAMVDKDKEVLNELTSENLDYGHSSGILENKAEFMDAVLNGSFDYISINPEEQQVELSEDIATVRHIFVSEGTNDGAPAHVRIGALLVFIKEGPQWKLRARQAYKL